VTRGQKLIVAETAAGFALIMLYIWRLRFTAPRAWIFILSFFLLSHIVRGERTASLGFRWSNFRECMESMAPAVLLIALSLMACGVFLETVRPISPEYGFMCLLAYCPWGIFQQYLLNGYIANRLSAVSSARRVPLLAAALFAGAHLPNWFLMLVTFAAGYVSTKIFMRYRNLYFLGLAHAVIGTLLFVVIPDSISHHLTVGPGFFARAGTRAYLGVPVTTRVVKAGVPAASAMFNTTLISAPAASALPPLTTRYASPKGDRQVVACTPVFSSSGGCVPTCKSLVTSVAQADGLAYRRWSWARRALEAAPQPNTGR